MTRHYKIRDHTQGMLALISHTSQNSVNFCGHDKYKIRLLQVDGQLSRTFDEDNVKSAFSKKKWIVLLKLSDCFVRHFFTYVQLNTPPCIFDACQLRTQLLVDCCSDFVDNLCLRVSKFET